MSQVSEAIKAYREVREDRLAREILAKEFDILNRPEAAAAVRGGADHSRGAAAAIAAIKRVARHTAAFLGRPFSRELAYIAIDSERDYQDAGRGNARRDSAEPPLSLGDHLVILRKILHDAEEAWYKPDGRAATLDYIRKLGGVAVHCMEDYGAPLRK